VYSNFFCIFIYLLYRRILVFGKCRITVSPYRYWRKSIPYRCNIGSGTASHSHGLQEDELCLRDTNIAMASLDSTTLAPMNSSSKKSLEAGTSCWGYTSLMEDSSSDVGRVPAQIVVVDCGAKDRRSTPEGMGHLMSPTMRQGTSRGSGTAPSLVPPLPHTGGANVTRPEEQGLLNTMVAEVDEIHPTRP
jgi:hypothetical protein